MSTKQTIRRGAVLGVFAATLAAVVLATGTPRTAAGHPENAHPATQRLIPPANLRVELLSHNHPQGLRVSWEPPHNHYPLELHTVDGQFAIGRSPEPGGFTTRYVLARYYLSITGLPQYGKGYELRRGKMKVPHSGDSYSETIHFRTVPGARYTVYVTPEVDAYLFKNDQEGNLRRTNSGGILRGRTAKASVTVPWQPPPPPEPPTTPEPEPPETETPTTPGPETPAQTCTYKHRLIGVPGTTGGGYTAQILIGSEDSKATVKLRAYQSDNGAPIDVLDSTGSAVGASTSLAPANSVKVFRLEGAQGWHTVIVEHPTRQAMENATVAMRLREPDVGVEIEHVQGIEDCTPAVTTTE